MREVINNSVYGEIVFDENAFTGKKVLTVNGVEATAVSKKEFLIDGKKATLKGNFITGVELLIEDDVVVLSPKPRWYESLISILPFLFVIIWGNNVSLCAVFPVLGGALGGAIGALGSILSLLFMKKARLIINKLLIGLAVFVLTVLINAILAFLIITLMF